MNGIHVRTAAIPAHQQQHHALSIKIRSSLGSQKSVLNNDQSYILCLPVACLVKGKTSRDCGVFEMYIDIT